MPSFRVHVASRDTGAESSIILAAADSSAAAEAANALGLMVSSVTEVEPAPMPPAPPDLRASINAMLDDRRTYQRLRKLITRAVSEGVLVGTVLAGIVFALLASCLSIASAHR